MKFFISIFIIIPLIASYSMGVIHVFKHISLIPYSQFYFFTFFVLSFILNFLFRKQTSYWAIFKHELTHNIFAIITFNKPTGFTVRKSEGGMFEYTGKGNFLITLSPYFFPTISFFILLIFIFDLNFKTLFYIFLGLAAGFDFSSSIKDIHPFQTDLKKYGYFFSLLIVLLGILFFWGILFSFVIGNWGFSLEYIKYGVLKIIEILSELINNVA